MSNDGVNRTVIGNLRRRLGFWSDAEVSKLLNMDRRDRFPGQRAAVVGDLEFIYFEDKLVAQPWNYLGLKTYSLYHPFLNIVHNAIVREVTKRSVIPMSNFAVKCKSCGKEYMRPVEECEECESTELRTPKDTERVRLQAFIKDPNRQNEMSQIIESILRDCLATSNAYISKDNIIGKEWEIWNEPTENMWIASDERGILGNGRWFCPKCYVATSDTTTDNNQVYNDPGNCPKCSGTLEETAYFFKKDSRMARFSKKEIIHFNSRPMLPFLYGWSDVISCLLELRSATAMSKFNYDNYSLMRMAKIVVHKGSNQAEANTIANTIEANEIALNEQAKAEGYVPKIQRILHLGSRQGVDVHDALPDPSKMQSLEWYDNWLVRIVAPIFGVQPVYINTGSGGAGGYFQRMEIAVNNDAIKRWRDLICGGFNENLLPEMGIKDWHLEFEPLEPIDTRAEAQTYREQLAALETAARLGIPAKLDDDGHLYISGEVDMEHFKEMMNPFGNTPFGQKPGQSQRIDNLPEGDKEPRQDGDTGFGSGQENVKR